MTPVAFPASQRELVAASLLARPDKPKPTNDPTIRSNA